MHKLLSVVALATLTGCPSALGFGMLSSNSVSRPPATAACACRMLTRREALQRRKEDGTSLRSTKEHSRGERDGQSTSLLLELLQQGWATHDAAAFSALGAAADGWERHDNALFANLEKIDASTDVSSWSIELLALACPLALAWSPGGFAPHRSWAHHDAALFDSSTKVMNTVPLLIDEIWEKHDAALFERAMALPIMFDAGWKKHDSTVLNAVLRYPEAYPAVSSKVRRRLARDHNHIYYTYIIHTHTHTHTLYLYICMCMYVCVCVCVIYTCIYSGSQATCARYLIKDELFLILDCHTCEALARGQ